MGARTIIATFDEDGEVLAWVSTPLVDPDSIIHSNGDDEAIRTYATEIEALSGDDDEDIQNALDMLAECHAIDAKHRSQSWS